MGGVEAAGQRAERGQDQLGLGNHETAPRHLAPFEVHPQLGVEMAGHFRARVAAHRFVAKDDPGNLQLVGQAAAAMVGEAGIVVADDPDPVELRRSFAVSKIARRGGQSVAAEAVVEAVAEAVDALGAGPLHLARQRRQRRVRIVWRKELPEPGEPARFLEVQVGDQQRLLGGPIKRTFCSRDEGLDRRTKREPCFS